MNTIFASKTYPVAASGLDLRKIMEEAIDGAPLNELIAAELVASISGKIPCIKSSDPVHPDLLVNGIVFKYFYNGNEQFGVGLAIKMPCLVRGECPDCALFWSPLPIGLQNQRTAPSGEYRHVRIGALHTLQARKTACFGHPYTYSSQVHPVEPETPEFVKSLFSLTNAIFGLAGERQVNMDLENHYPTGRHYISEHSDSEKQFGPLKDVICWTFGEAERQATFRVIAKTRQRTVEKHLQSLCRDPQSPYETRQLLSIFLPKGLYSMRGREFQQQYTHEFPQYGSSQFTRLCKLLEEEKWENFPITVEKTSRGASQKSLMQADWIKENQELVETFLSERDESARINGKRTKTSRSTQNLCIWFSEWCKSRTSHTLRCFVAE